MSKKEKGKYKKLALALAYATDQEQVKSILKKEGFWDDPESWRYYGDNENNFSTAGAQQNAPDTALREQVINAVDAYLMRIALENGIVPEGDGAPKSIREALISFFNIYDGKLYNITASERTKLSENIMLVATGSKDAPCYSVIDKGEGQSPDRMPDTLLSLSKSNKLKIGFVQGKFNMGRTGAFAYCGKYGLQFVISRRCPAIVTDADGERSDEWGFTIIRKVPPRDGMRSSAYMYLAPGGSVPSFKAGSIPILPGTYPNATTEPLEFGTAVIHYNYEIGPGYRTNILFDLYNRMSLLIPKVALPIRMIERRLGYSGHSFESTMSGLEVRLEDDGSKNLENGYPSSAHLQLEDFVLPMTIYAFKRDSAKKYKKSEAIVFTINGQTQGSLDARFLRRKNVGMGYLADSILIELDCTGMPIDQQEMLLMNSRDRLRKGNLLNSIEKALERIIKYHPGLKELRERRRREDVENKLGDSKPLADTIKHLLKQSPSLAILFKKGVRLPNPFKNKTIKTGKEYKGEWFPTQFKLDRSFPKEKPRNVAINQRLRVKFITDAQNDYFTRSKEPGEFSLRVNGELCTAVLNLWYGFANLNIELPKDVKEGDMLHFESEIMDISRVTPIKDEFYAVVGPAVSKNGSNGGKRKKRGGKKGNDSNSNENLSLPEVFEVRQDEWERYGFVQESAMKAEYNGKAWDFWVNMDNTSLKYELKTNSRQSVKLLEARFKYGLTLFTLGLIKDFEDSKKDDGDGDINNIILIGTKALAKVLLPVISSLGELEIEEVPVNEELSLV